MDKISALMFADDLILLSTSKTGLQNSLNVLENYTKRWKLEINYKKTKCITFSKSNHIGSYTRWYKAPSSVREVRGSIPTRVESNV